MANVTGLYYAGEAIHGYGAELRVGDGNSPEAFESVADIESITPGDMTTATIQKTHLRSPDAHHEKMLGLRDSGPWTVTGNWRPKHESHSNAGSGSSVAFQNGGLLAMWVARTERNFQIILNDGSPQTVFPIAGGLTRFQPGEITVDGKIPFTFEITPLRDFSAQLP